LPFVIDKAVNKIQSLLKWAVCHITSIE
jgi:hypothetical protein